MDSANSRHSEEQPDSWCYEQDLPDSDLLYYLQDSTVLQD